MAQTFKPCTWKLKTASGYIRNENISKRIVPQLIHYLIARFISLSDKFIPLKKESAKIKGSIIEGTNHFSEVIGTIPFKLHEENKVFKWTFKITKLKSSPFISAISFGIQDKNNWLQVFYDEFGTKVTLYGDEELYFHNSTKDYGDGFTQNDEISIILTKDTISFKKNGNKVNEAFKYMTDYCEQRKFEEFFCYIRLNESSQILAISFDMFN